MSSNAEPRLCMTTLARIAFLSALAAGQGVAAQDDAIVTQSKLEPGREEVASESLPDEAADDEGTEDEGATDQPAPPPPQRVIFDLSVTVPQSKSDRLIEKDCEDANDAGRIANEIVVCRQLGTSATDGSWNKAEWERRYAEKTKGGTTPNTFGIPNYGNPIGFGSVPPPAYIIDFDELPPPPPGSDADRIARGLPPLGKRELTEEEERARRAALGVETAPLPEK